MCIILQNDIYILSFLQYHAGSPRHSYLHAMPEAPTTILQPHLRYNVADNDFDLDTAAAMFSESPAHAVHPIISPRYLNQYQQRQHLQFQNIYAPQPQQQLLYSRPHFQRQHSVNTELLSSNTTSTSASQTPPDLPSLSYDSFAGNMYENIVPPMYGITTTATTTSTDYGYGGADMPLSSLESTTERPASLTFQYTGTSSRSRLRSSLKKYSNDSAVDSLTTTTTHTTTGTSSSLSASSTPASLGGHNNGSLAIKHTPCDSLTSDDSSYLSARDEQYHSAVSTAPSRSPSSSQGRVRFSPEAYVSALNAEAALSQQHSDGRRASSASSATATAASLAACAGPTFHPRGSLFRRNSASPSSSTVPAPSAAAVLRSNSLSAPSS